MKLALVYDRVTKIGGAERVLLSLHEIWPEAPIYTAVYHKAGAPWARVFDIHTTFLSPIPYKNVLKTTIIEPLMKLFFLQFRQIYLKRKDASFHNKQNLFKA